MSKKGFMKSVVIICAIFMYMLPQYYTAAETYHHGYLIGLLIGGAIAV